MNDEHSSAAGPRHLEFTDERDDRRWLVRELPSVIARDSGPNERAQMSRGPGLLFNSCDGADQRFAATVRPLSHFAAASDELRRHFRDAQPLAGDYFPSTAREYTRRGWGSLGCDMAAWQRAHASGR